VEIGVPQRTVGTPVGDRLYLGLKRELLGVSTSELENPSRVRAGPYTTRSQVLSEHAGADSVPNGGGSGP
jgi:hypothetical protein